MQRGGTEKLQATPVVVACSYYLHFKLYFVLFSLNCKVYAGIRRYILIKLIVLAGQNGI